MSQSAREIAEERLARGEINHDEFQRIAESISPKTTSQAVSPRAESAQRHAATSGRTIFWLFLLPTALIFGFGMFSGDSEPDLQAALGLGPRAFAFATGVYIALTGFGIIGILFKK